MKNINRFFTWLFWFDFKTHQPKPKVRILVLCSDRTVYSAKACDCGCGKVYYETECQCPTTIENGIMWRKMPVIPNNS